MTRTLGELSPNERAEALAAIHHEAEQAEWHKLNNQQRANLYRRWERRFNLKHSAIKDQIMKGFDAAQHIAPSGEAAVHERVKNLLRNSKIPFWADKVLLWQRKGVVDFILGFSPQWVTVACELESVVTWHEGLTQALWYRAAFFNELNLQVLPGLILFGDATTARWDEIKTTCATLNVLLVAFDLRVDGSIPDVSLEMLLKN